jgi:hypothetical protein
VISGPLLLLFVSALGMDGLLANALSLVLLVLARFAISDRYIWRHKPTESGDSRSARQRVSTIADCFRIAERPPVSERRAYTLGPTLVHLVTE